MKKTLLALAIAVGCTGCTAGPNYLSRTVDDWQNNGYVENPLMTGIMSDVVPAYGIAKILAFIPDWLIINPIQFWAVDIWRAEGAGFEHENPDTSNRAWVVDELPSDDEMK